MMIGNLYWDLKINAIRSLLLKGLVLGLIVLPAASLFAIIPAVQASAATTNATITGIAGKCLDDKWAETTDTNPIWLHHCNGSVAEQWDVNSDGTIQNQGSCLDVQWAGTKPQTPVQLYTCNGTAAQQWVVNKDLTIVNPHSNLCLDDKWAGTRDTNPIWVYNCNSTAAQHWTVVAPTPAPVTTAPSPAVAPTPAPATYSPPPQSCYPLTNGGNCYEPGEYCRNSDHGATGVAGDGKAIICADNNGWRWEPN